MKYIFCLGALILFYLFSYGQDRNKGINLESVTIDVSLEAGIPIGTMKGSGIGPGSALHFGYPIRDQWNVTGTAGYMRFTSKGKNGSGSDFTFYLLGAQYHITLPIHIDAGVGYSIFRGVTKHPFFPNGIEYNNKGFAFAAGAGYRLTEKIDVSLRFQKGKTVSFIGARLSLRISK